MEVPQGQTVRLSQRLNTFKVRKVQKPLSKVMLMGGGQKTLLMGSSTLPAGSSGSGLHPGAAPPHPDQTTKSIKNKDMMNIINLLPPIVIVGFCITPE